MKTKRKLLVWAGLLIAYSLIIPYQTKAASDFWTISIANPENPDEWFTIMDRNLWATSNDINNPNSYGHYYQWWNNYGFPSSEEVKKISANQVDASNYWPWNYYENDTFIIWNNWDSSNNKNLWWWGNDSADNWRWIDLNNSPDRQWPCPKWYHIPSLWEWLLLTKYWADKNNKTYKYYPERGVLELDRWYSDFRNYFKIPLAWEYYLSGDKEGFESNYRNYLFGNDYEYDSVLIRFQGHQSNPSSRYRSSTPAIESSSPDNSRNFYVDDAFYFYVGNTDNRNKTSSIRCFKNTYEPETRENPNNNQKEYPAEFVDSYLRAYEKWIISESTIENANLFDTLTNLELADIMNKFAEKILKQTPDPDRVCTFNDISWLTTSKQNIIKESCQLWLIPIEKNKKSFNPNQTANRATFWTMLSRVLRWARYDGGNPYYIDHLNALKAAWIINQIDSPESRNEIKWYLLNMLKSSSNNNFNNTDCNDPTIKSLCENNSKLCPSNCKTKTIEKTEEETVKTTEKTEKIQNEQTENSQKNQTNTNTEKPAQKDNNSITPAQVVTYKQREQSSWNPTDVLQNGYTREINNAYQFAYKNGITTVNNIEKAKINSWLTRIAMAKMLSNYAINILWKKPDTSKWTKNFNDVTTKQNADYDNAVTLSYQLWIMWQWTNNFRPNDEVTRAEFATALSRMLYSTPDWNDKYYTTHLTKLKQEWIISNDNPKIKEKRWYVMLMLMRTIK